MLLMMIMTLAASVSQNSADPAYEKQLREQAGVRR
jgi:hypothetical protein